MGRYLFIQRKKNHTFRNLFITFILACVCVTGALFYLSNQSASANLNPSSIINHREEPGQPENYSAETEEIASEEDPAKDNAKPENIEQSPGENNSGDPSSLPESVSSNVYKAEDNAAEQISGADNSQNP